MSEEKPLTIFDMCAEIAHSSIPQSHRAIADRITRQVIQTIIDTTPSPRTVEELTRILVEHDAD